MPTTLIALALLGNVIAIVAGLAGLARWLRKSFRAMLLRTISEPLAQIQLTLDSLKSDVHRAHERLDRHLESHA